MKLSYRSFKSAQYVKKTARKILQLLNKEIEKPRVDTSKQKASG